jgi:CrcB protein
VERDSEDIARDREEHKVDLDADLLVDPDAEVDLPRDDVHRLRDEIDILATIAIGGFFGTLCRYELNLHWTQNGSTFPLTIFVINVTGSLAIGLVLSVILENLRPTRYLRPLTCIGFLGGWTTMSTLAVVSDNLISSGHIGIALNYLIATGVMTPLASALGISLAHRLPRQHRKPQQAAF